MTLPNIIIDHYHFLVSLKYLIILIDYKYQILLLKICDVSISLNMKQYRIPNCLRIEDKLIRFNYFSLPANDKL